MGYNCGDCQTPDYACMAWDGKGVNEERMGEAIILNHNLIEECPADYTKCEYRSKKTNFSMAPELEAVWEGSPPVIGGIPDAVLKAFGEKGEEC